MAHPSLRKGPSAKNTARNPQSALEHLDNIFLAHDNFSLASLQQFEIVELIAKGGMAEVYRARTSGVEGFEKEVCIKKILPELTEDKSFIEMFINEAKLAATLDFSNIVRVQDLCVSGQNEYFIVMEFVDGPDLSDLIRAAYHQSSKVPPELSVYIMREVLKGLAYAHKKNDQNGQPLNIIHRDISPHNVMVSRNGEVKILDFGIAKTSSIATKTAAGVLKGKYGYMSPEQARGEHLDKRSDLFNSGIVLYELLTGERCFAGASDFSTLTMMREADITPPRKINASIPNELEKIVLKSLSKERDNRYQDAMEMEGDLSFFAQTSSYKTTADSLGDYIRQTMSQNQIADKVVTNQPERLKLASVVQAPPSAPTPKTPPKRNTVVVKDVEEAKSSSASVNQKQLDTEMVSRSDKARKMVEDALVGGAEPQVTEPPKRVPVGLKHLGRDKEKPASKRFSTAIGITLSMAAFLIGISLGLIKKSASSSPNVFRELEEAAAETGDAQFVLVKSTPTDATVVLNDKSYQTPFFLKDPKRFPKTVSFKKRGFRPEMTKPALDPKKPFNVVSADLVPKPGNEPNPKSEDPKAATLIITGNRKGFVSVDDSDTHALGEEIVLPGEKTHRFRVESEGKSMSFKLKLAKGERRKLFLDLTEKQ